MIRKVRRQLRKVQTWALEQSTKDEGGAKAYLAVVEFIQRLLDDAARKDGDK